METKKIYCLVERNQLNDIFSQLSKIKDNGLSDIIRIEIKKLSSGNFAVIGIPRILIRGL